MDKPLLAYTLWLSYSQDQRSKLVKLFSIPRTGESVVHVGAIINGNIGGERKQDGHRPEDLYAINIERIYELLNQDLPEAADQNFYGAFQEVMDNLDAIYYEQYPDDENLTEKIVAIGTDMAVAQMGLASEPVKEEEFVPRDPEELLKRQQDMSEPEPIDLSDGVSTVEPVKGETVSIDTSKTTKNAKTTEAKGTKAK